VFVSRSIGVGVLGVEDGCSEGDGRDNEAGGLGRYWR
jgi:hypothetical protein